MDDETNLKDWIGRTMEAEDVLRPEPARFMQATLDRTSDLTVGSELPHLWHWLYFLEAKRPSELGRDAHPRRGGFLPPVPLPRRMWAGGRFRFHMPLILGQKTNRTSTIKDVVEKDGRTGQLCFVTVQHNIYQGSRLALTEEHDIVYRADPDPGAPKAQLMQAPDHADASQVVHPTEVLLFRYSALTFNGHRIHYDAAYARDVEGYEGLVFHGPLTATLLIDMVLGKFARRPKRFEFRGLAPLSGMHAFKIEACLNSDKVDLWAKRHDDALAMTATAYF